MGNVNANIYIVRVHGAQGGLIGHLKNIPGFLRRRSLQHFHRDSKNKRVVKDNLCFFRCLSYYLFKGTCHSRELLQAFFPNETPATYKGIALSDLNRIEVHYNITNRVVEEYECNWKKIKKNNKEVNQVTEARREGDKNPDCKILSHLYKLLGNSSYGKTICNKQNFTDTRYMSPEKARQIALHWTVQDVQNLTENNCEDLTSHYHNLRPPYTDRVHGVPVH